MEVSSPEYLASEAALSRFVADFENGTFPASQYHHAEHLAVAVCYLLSSNDEEATTRMRDRIRAYNVAQGGSNTETSGYHETLTVFWLQLIRANLPGGVSRLEAVKQIQKQFGLTRDLFRQYYSFDVVNSKEARAWWIAPDLRPVGPVSFLASVPETSQT